MLCGSRRAAADHFVDVYGRQRRANVQKTAERPLAHTCRDVRVVATAEPLGISRAVASSNRVDGATPDLSHTAGSGWQPGASTEESRYPRGAERFFADERERRSISMPSRRQASPYSKRLSLLSGAPSVNSLVRSG